jgi:hypothetical protein
LFHDQSYTFLGFSSSFSTFRGTTSASGERPTHQIKKIDQKKKSRLAFRSSSLLGVTRGQSELALFCSFFLIGRLALSPYPSSFACSLHHAMRIERSYSIRVLGRKDYRLLYNFYNTGEQEEMGQPNIWRFISDSSFFFFIAVVSMY